MDFRHETKSFDMTLYDVYSNFNGVYDNCEACYADKMFKLSLSILNNDKIILENVSGAHTEVLMTRTHNHDNLLFLNFSVMALQSTINNGVARTLKNLRTSKRDYWIKQWFFPLRAVP